MEFKEELPKWGNEGVEPPLSKQEEGWNAGDKPPAAWMNWFQNRTFKSIAELREIAKDLNINIQDIDRVDDVNKLKEEILKKASQEEVDKKADISYVDKELKKAGKVGSVNGKTGDVKLTASDIPYDDIFSIETELRSKAYKWDLDDKANKAHSHSANDINETFNRKFVTESEKEEISKVKEKADISYVDEELDEKASKYHSHSALAITETFNRKFVTESEKEEIAKVKDKANKSHDHLASDITPVASKQFVTHSEKEGVKGVRADLTDTYTTSTPNSCVLIGSDSSRAASKNSTIIASEGSKTSQARSAVIASKNSETDGAHYSNRSGNVILASHGVKTPSGSRNLVVGGCASDTGASPSVDNIKWKLDGVEGTLWVDYDVEIGNMSVKKEIDNLKQSGVESNKILVDALNSKGVSASTSNTIKTNVNKVKDIQVGDYSIGDYVLYENLDFNLTSNGIAVRMFDTTISNPTAVAMSDKYIYVGTSSGRLLKYNYSGTKMWDKSISSSEITAMDIDRDKEYIYIGLENKELKKVNSSGGVIWTKELSDKPENLTFKNGYIYTKGYDWVTKMSEGGNIQWSTREYKTYSQIAVDKDGYIYIVGDYLNTSNPKYVFKISPSGKEVNNYLIEEVSGINLSKVYKGIALVGDQIMVGAVAYQGTAMLLLDSDLSLQNMIYMHGSSLKDGIANLVTDENGNDVYGISGNYIVKLSRWGGIKWRTWQDSAIKDIDSCNNFIACVYGDTLKLLSTMPIFGVYLK